MKIRIVNNMNKKATRKDFILLAVVGVILLTALMIAPSSNVAPQSLQYTNYSGCIYDSYYTQAYCAPIKTGDNSWNDVNPNSPYLIEG